MTTTLESMKSLVQQFNQHINNHDVAGSLVLVDDQLIDHNAVLGESGVASYTKWLQTYLAAFPDFSAQIDDLMGENETVVCRLKLSGTQQAEFFGAPASWKPFSVYGIEIYRIADGKIAERWSWLDMMGLRTQLGITS